MDDLHPAALAACFSGTFIGAFMPPGDHAVREWVVGPVVEAVVEGQGDVKRIQFGSKGFGAVVVAGCFIRVIVSAVVFLPFGVP